MPYPPPQYDNNRTSALRAGLAWLFGITVRASGYNPRTLTGKLWTSRAGWPSRPSEHAYTRALDVMRQLIAEQRFGHLDKAAAWDAAGEVCEQIAQWAVWVAQHPQHRATYGWIDNVIWNRRIWTYARRAEGWRPYTGASDHTDHVHIGLWSPELGEPHP